MSPMGVCAQRRLEMTLSQLSHAQLLELGDEDLRAALSGLPPKRIRLRLPRAGLLTVLGTRLTFQCFAELWWGSSLRLAEVWMTGSISRETLDLTPEFMQFSSPRGG